MRAVDAELLVAGSCTHPEHVVLRNWRLRSMEFPATLAVIRHPEHGVVLYDTGYSQRFLDATRPFPERLYRWVTPVTIPPGATAAEQLRARGVDPEDVRRIVVSHFHADHVGGLADFPRARYVFLESSWAAVRDLRGVGALRRGFLPGLLPADFDARGLPVDTRHPRPLPPELAPFTHGYDLFGDGSLLAVELAGHAAGQMGLVLRRPDGGLWFLVADACWTSRCYRERTPPHGLTRLLFDDTREYRRTLERIADVHDGSPAVRIIPSHCSEAVESAARACNLERVAN
jgi:glyoxylase-like metal-dependent hydrolase (beta-lactamase superfamily II)